MRSLTACSQPREGVTPSMFISYYDYLRDAGVYRARARLINCLKRNNGNVTATAQDMGTTRVTVRKVWRQYCRGGFSGLSDGRHGPMTPYNRIDPAWEHQILSDYQSGPIKTLTSFRIVFNRCYGTTFSYHVFDRVTRAERNRYKPTFKKKHKRQRTLREKYQQDPDGALRHWQFDPKYLDDIEYFYPQMKALDLPRYQLGFRDVVTGSTFFSYSHSLTKNVMEAAIARFLEHLQRWNIRLEGLDLQTDNDTAMVNHSGKQRTAFTRIIEDVYGASHSQIPPGACWLQGYIESFNWTCEQMFYRVEDFGSFKEFLEKAITWQLTYNLIRPAPALGDRTPYEVAKQHYPQLTPKFYLNLPPMVYDGDEPSPRIKETGEGGYYLSGEAKKQENGLKTLSYTPEFGFILYGL